MPLKLSDEEKHPVVAGLIALAAVAAVLGVVAGVFALLASNVAGVGGAKETAAQAANQGASLYLPSPKPTKSATGPLITLTADPQSDESPTGGTSTSATASPSASASPQAKAISLSASRSEVGSMERIDLSGVYPDGEGAVLQVQRKEGGRWADFPVTAGVSGGQFSTYVQTGRAGKQAWRVVDTDSKIASNVVKVTVR